MKRPEGFDRKAPAAPPISNNADMHSVYALITHCIAESDVFKSASMRGNATLTTDSSTKAIVDASTAQMSTQRFWCVSVVLGVIGAIVHKRRVVRGRLSQQGSS